jgi:hypothetical protein
MQKNRVQFQKAVSLTAFFSAQYGCWAMSRMPCRALYHAVHPKHLPRYLAEFCYRFNHRFDLGNLFPGLAVAATQTAPMPHQLVTLTKTHC